MKVETPNRKKHSYVQNLYATPDMVFPLLCPVMEIEWVPDWMPIKVISESGVAEQECMFITPAQPQNSIWVISKHDPVNFQLEMYKFTPEHTIAKLEITLSTKNGTSTEASISYEFTAIGQKGEEFLREFTADWYGKFMVVWENAMNHYLTKGEKLSDV
jgi:hypothetical protein